MDARTKRIAAGNRAGMSALRWLSRDDGEQRTHDFTLGGWGHDYTIMKVIDKGMQLRLGGWGSGIQQDDYLILRNGKDSSRYQVEEIEYMRDPRDQWFATAKYAPRTQEEA